MFFNFKKVVFYSSLLCIGMLLMQCKKDVEKIDTQDQKKSSSKKDSLKKVEDSLPNIQPTINFKAFIFPKAKKDSAMEKFLETYSEEERHTILALNRLDNKNRWRADTLIIPEKIEKDFLAYSPFPKMLDSLKNVKKIAFFSYDIHAYALYESGNLIKWGPTSMGKKATPTKTGLKFTNWKKEVAISTSNSEWKLRWNFNVHNTLGIGWHQYDLPGFHASHSCMRLLEEDAKWMYDWADVWVLSDGGNTVKAKGTPVIIFGESDFKTKPWLKLLQNPSANDISVEDMNKVFVPYLSEILKEQKNSEEVRNAKMLSKTQNKNAETQKERI